MGRREKEKGKKREMWGEKGEGGGRRKVGGEEVRERERGESEGKMGGGEKGK